MYGTQARHHAPFSDCTAFVSFLAPFISLAASQSSILFATPVWPSQAFFNKLSLQPPIFEIGNTSTTSPDGLLFLSPGGNGSASNAPMIMDFNDTLGWLDFTGEMTNMCTQELNGTTYITYWSGNPSAAFGRAYGAVHVLDESYTERYKVCLAELYFQTANNFTQACNVDVHEQRITERDGIVVTAYNATQQDLSSSRFYDIVIATGAILFSWKSLDHQDVLPLVDSQEPLSIFGNPTGLVQSLAWDYFHTISIQPHADGYLLNPRHSWEIIKIGFDRSIEWRLQGFNDHSDFDILDAGASFKWQHHIRAERITDESLAANVHDDYIREVVNGTGPTTGLELNISPRNRAVALSKRLIDPADLVSASQEGSYQALAHGHVLLGSGAIPKLREVDQDGSVVYAAHFGYDVTAASYRAFSVDNWDGYPATPPKIVFMTAEDGIGTKVYAKVERGDGV
ncbi:hypothetical protein LTR53_003971 [Teratosphaeriaceae sp. CCFEE 6253]|nr:hypothetical protein LTR53_003971 [Teratosphaeriaceae sp. CCFEE 6253]